MFEFIDQLNILVLVISLLIAGGIGFFLYKRVEPTKEMKIPVIAYETIIMIMALSALQLFLSQGSYFGVFVFAGSLCFVASDTALAFVTFKERHYYVFCMATYIAAQFLISFGFSRVIG